MSTWARIGVALQVTVALGLAGILYQQVFVESLLPEVSRDGLFSQPVMILENIVPVVIVAILLATWIWVIAGAVQDERTVNRQVRRR